MTPTALLFDLDGTLVDTIGQYEKACTIAFAEHGMSVTPEEFTQWYRDAWHLTQMLAHYGKTEADAPGIRERRDALYVELLRTDAAWLPGAEEALTRLRDAGMPLALVTGSWKQYVDALDARLDLRRFFPVQVTMDDMGKLSKPHPHGLLLACDALGVRPEECAYVGDQLFDAEAAHRAGMPCWTVRGRFSPPDIHARGNRILASIAEAADGY
jgi:HAD superfamily hydrolase (TIGR01509 family)